MSGLYGNGYFDNDNGQTDDILFQENISMSLLIKLASYKCVASSIFILKIFYTYFLLFLCFDNYSMIVRTNGKKSMIG